LIQSSSPLPIRKELESRRRAAISAVKPLGQETYRVTISGGVIIDRWRAQPEATCALESYQPI
jgi:hypothetical protein